MLISEQDTPVLCRRWFKNFIVDKLKYLVCRYLWLLVQGR